MNHEILFEMLKRKNATFDLELFHAMCEEWPGIAVDRASKTPSGRRMIRQEALHQFMDEYGGDVTLGEVLKDVAGEILDRNKEVRP